MFAPILLYPTNDTGTHKYVTICVTEAARQEAEAAAWLARAQKYISLQIGATVCLFGKGSFEFWTIFSFT